MRLISVGAPAWNFSAPQPTGSAWSDATSTSPAGGRSSASVAETLRAGIEAAVEPAVELLGVRAHAVARVRMGRIDDVDPHQRSGQQSLDLRHRPDEPRALSVAERLQERHRQLVGAPLQHAALGEPRRGEPRDADPAVALAGLERHQAGGLQAAEQAAEVAGVELELLAQRADLVPVVPDLPQHAGRAERTSPCEEVVVERAHPLRDDPVEPPHLGDHRGIHSLTLVSNRRSRQPS